MKIDEECPSCGFFVKKIDAFCFRSSSLDLDSNYEIQTEIYSRSNRGVTQALIKLSNYEFEYHSTSYLVKKYLNKYIRTGDIVLDIGFAGNPRLHYFAYRRKTTGIGVDISLTNCRVQAKISEFASTNNIYINANALNIPIPDESADFVIATDIIEHISSNDKHAFMAEMHRILKKGGMILLRSPFEKEIPFSLNYIKEKLNHS